MVFRNPLSGDGSAIPKPPRQSRVLQCVQLIGELVNNQGANHGPPRVQGMQPATPDRWHCSDRLADTTGMARHLPAGFIMPARPVPASRPPSGADWVHEIKHDGYRMIVRRDGPIVRLYSRNGYDWTSTAIAGTAERIKAKSFTIDGEAVVLGTACRSSRIFAEWTRRIRRSSTRSTLSSMTARTCAISRSSTARPRWRDCCVISRRASCSINTL